MTPFWIDTRSNLRLAIVPRPRGGDWLENDLTAIKNAGIDVLVSTLTSLEEVELGLEREAALCLKLDLQFRSFPIPDRDIPESQSTFAAFLDSLENQLNSGRAIGVHCRTCIGRSSLLLAALLCRRGWKPQAAFEAIGIARNAIVPDTPAQQAWLERFAEN